MLERDPLGQRDSVETFSREQLDDELQTLDLVLRSSEESPDQLEQVHLL